MARAARAAVGRARDHRPGLRDRIDPALLARSPSRAACRRRSRRADTSRRPRPRARARLAARRRALASRGARRVAACVGKRRERDERRVEKPAEPDAFAPAVFADAVHAVVPVAGADQRQAVAPTCQAGIEAAGAVLEQRADLVGDRRAGRSCRARRPADAAPSRNGTISSSTAASPVALDIVRDGVGEPDPVVGDPRAHALTRMRQPPMLHVALDELPRRGAQQVLARHRRLRGDQRHAVLQLVAEAVGAARLVEAERAQMRQASV